MSDLTADIEKGEGILRMERQFAASAERLFNAWTTSEGLSQWFRPADQLSTVATADCRVGGDYRIEMHPKDGSDPFVVLGTYQEVEPFSRVVFSWRWEHEELPPSRITVELHELSPNETNLTLIHDKLSNDAERDNHAYGWQGTFATLLQQLAKGTI